MADDPRLKAELLLGQLAIRKGVVKPDQVDECLAEQEACTGRGEARPPLGAVLLRKGYITDEALDALLAAQMETLHSFAASSDTGKVDALFGKRLVSMNLATQDQVNDALRLQGRLRSRGIPLGLGELLVSRGVLTPERVREVLAQQEKAILSCPKCGKLFNVHAYSPSKTFPCPKCGEALVLSKPSEPVRVSGALAPRQDDPPSAVTMIRDASEDPPTIPPKGRSATRATRFPPSAGPQAGAPAEPSGEPFGRYRLIKELGRGGMGVVFKAWDGELKRMVALKTLLQEGELTDSDSVERFLREARSAGRLRHPNIVQVHDVGTCEGRHYFTMDFIEGESLDAAKARLSTRRFVEVLRDVALALAAAHKGGVVHRDVKPGNILLDASGHPFVTDFGLAREVKGRTGRQVTVSGSVMGTPFYMSPEQAQGRLDQIGAWSDQWSLGVMLYEHLAGKTPFERGGMIEILTAIVRDEPVPPSRVKRGRGAAKRVNPDLETICLKCLEKQPRRRYASTERLAADLSHWLAGEAIEARPPSLTYKMERFVARRRGLAASIALVLVAGCAAGYFAWRAHEEHAKAQQTLQEGALVQEVRTRLAEALGARRGGDVRLLEKAASEVEQEADALLAKDPTRSDAHYVKGWLYRLVGRLDDADRELAAAVEARPDDTAAHYQKGLVSSERARELTVEARRAWREKHPDATDKGPTPTELEALRPRIADRRSEASAELERVAGSKAEAAGAGWVACARGIVALCKRDTGAAEGALKEALAQDAYLDEARLAWLDLLWARFSSGEFPLTDLIDQYDAAIAVNKGLAELWRGRAEARNLQAISLSARGHHDAAADVWQKGDQDVLQALSLAPGRADLSATQAELQAARAVASANQGAGARNAQEEVIAQTTRAIQKDPEDVLAYRNRANAYLQLGEVLRTRGEDPCEAFRRALSDLDEVLRRRPGDTSAWSDRATARINLAAYDTQGGRDPREAYRAAIADCDEALKRDPGLVYAYNSRAEAWRSIAEAEAMRDLDPRESYRKAVADFEEALKRGSAMAALWNNAANTLNLLGEAETDHGQDARDIYRRAMEDCNRAISLDPRLPQPYYVRGMSKLRRAQTDMQLGVDARDTLQDAIRDYDTALAKNPEYPDAFEFRGNARYIYGQALQARGLDPCDAWRAALADFGEAIRRKYDLARVVPNRGIAGMSLGQAEEAQGKDARDRYASALADLEEATRAAPGNLSYAGSHAVVLVLFGRAEVARGRDATETLTRGVAELTALLQKAPSPDCTCYRARGHRALGDLLKVRGKDPGEEYAQAIADFEMVVKSSPTLADTARKELEALRSARK